MSESVAMPAVLGRQQCLRLLAGCRYGRVVLTEHALPSVVTVAFRVDDEGVVVGDNGDGRLAGLIDGSVVAFQTDRTDAEGGSAWSVSVTGYANTVTDPTRAAPGTAGDGSSRAVPAGRLVRISPTVVTGWSFTLPE
ncbi:pyridoxamine 5'-phosphate oxidase family protein [Kitasatospora sp. NPDC094028]